MSAPDVPSAQGAQRDGEAPDTELRAILADPLRRLVARILDLLVLTLILSAVLVPLIVIGVRQAGPDGEPPAWLAAVFLLFYFFGGNVIYFLYEWLQLATWGRTVGKRALGLRVVSLDARRDVRTAGAAARASVLALPQILPCLGALFTLIDRMWLLWDRPYWQCLHDKVAGTTVVQT